MNPREVVRQLLTQREAALSLGVSVAYLRASTCPKVLLPPTPTRKAARRPLLRYDPDAVREWWSRFRTDTSERSA